jgi:hypothetical protein
MEGIFSGKLIKNEKTTREPVQYGPLTIPKIKDPIDKLIDASVGKFPYEANGLVHLDPDKIEFLGS